MTATENDTRPIRSAAPTDRGRERAHAILETARAIAADSGIAALSMRSVAARVGISLGNLQHYSPTKEDLIEATHMAKRWGTEQQCKVTDEWLQLFGGYGYMADHPIARTYADARIQRISGGTTEIMKDLVAWELLA